MSKLRWGALAPVAGLLLGGLLPGFLPVSADGRSRVCASLGCFQPFSLCWWHACLAQLKLSNAFSLQAAAAAAAASAGWARACQLVLGPPVVAFFQVKANLKRAFAARFSFAFPGKLLPRASGSSSCCCFAGKALFPSAGLVAREMGARGFSFAVPILQALLGLLPSGGYPALAGHWQLFLTMLVCVFAARSSHPKLKTSLAHSCILHFAKEHGPFRPERRVQSNRKKPCMPVLGQCCMLLLFCQAEYACIRPSGGQRGRAGMQSEVGAQCSKVSASRGAMVIR